ncbi:MAG: hypothetical protein K2J60_03570 [Acetatifactor sp.]|nr:hypothetical protein [Acetatifactor sp.]
MEQLMIQIHNMEDVEREIDKAQRKACTSIVEIGYILRKADDSELYRERGFSSIFAFAKETYGWDQSRTSRFMAINREYSDGGYSTVLKAQYEGFGEAKLSEMLLLPEGIREELDPEMKRDEIRSIKSEFKEAEQERESREFEESFAPAQMKPLGTLLEKCILDLFRIEQFARQVPELWEYMKQYNEGNAVNEQDVLMAVKPNGYGHARAGSCMCFFRKDEISVVSGLRKEKYTYADFLRVLLQASGEVELDEPDSWYRNVFGEELPSSKTEVKNVANNESSLAKSDLGKEEKKDGDLTEKPSGAAVQNDTNKESLPAKSDLAKEEKTDGNLTEKPSGAAVEDTANNESPPAKIDSEVMADKVDGVCQYCIGNKEIESNDRAITIHLAPSGLARVEESIGRTFGIVEFEYCPKCGKKLLDEINETDGIQ